MSSIYTKGIIHGRMIELKDDLGLTDGQRVELIVHPVREPATCGDGLRRCAGAMAEVWTESDDRALEELHHERHTDTRAEADA